MGSPYPKLRSNDSWAGGAGKSEPMSAARFLPDEVEDLARLAAAAARCEGCDLYRRATGTVFGAGRAGAPLMLIGEQPGDREDREGRPFVGPAGHLLDRALGEAGIARDAVYVTNAVKHFKWEARGGRRLHKKPSSGEIAACAPWLAAEITAVRPRLLVCLGATAAQALLGPRFKVTERRGEVIEAGDRPPILATVHPASILRGAPEARERSVASFVDDLRRAAAFAERAA